MATGQIHLLPGDECRALEPQQGTLKYEEMNSFLVTLNLGSKLSTEYIQKYHEAGDELGVECLGHLEKRVNATVSAFNTRMNEFVKDGQMLELYLTDVSFLGREKRAAGAVIFAVLVSLTNIAATAMNIAYSNIKLTNMDYRLNLMAEKIKILESNQAISHNNMELLFDKNEFLGLQKDLIVNHINEIKTIHSCNVLSMGFETHLHKLEIQLQKVFETLHSKRLSSELINFQTLMSITGQDLFEGTIYRISPFLLYDYSSVEMVSFNNNILTLLVNYPKIGDQFGFMLYDLLEIPSKVGATNGFFQQNSFLLPYDMPIDHVFNSTNVIRTSKYCKTKRSMIVCPDVYSPSFCLESILKGNDSNKLCPKTVLSNSDPRITYTKKGALLKLRPHEYVRGVNIPNDYLAKEGENLCIFVAKNKKLILGSTTEGWNRKIFPGAKMHEFFLPSHFRKLPVVKANLMRNLTLPAFNTTREFLTPQIVQKFDFYTLALIAVGTSVFVTIILFLILLLMTKKCVAGTTDGAGLFP